jgi:hypothetical protein
MKKTIALVFSKIIILFFIACLTLNVKAQQSEALFIAPNGNVGIGTNKPLSPLQIDRPFNVQSPLLSLKQTTPSWGSVELFNSFLFIQTNFAGDANNGKFKQLNVGAGGVSIGYTKVPLYGSADALLVNGNVVLELLRLITF